MGYATYSNPTYYEVEFTEDTNERLTLVRDRINEELAHREQIAAEKLELEIKAAKAFLEAKGYEVAKKKVQPAKPDREMEKKIAEMLNTPQTEAERLREYIQNTCACGSGPCNCEAAQK